MSYFRGLMTLEERTAMLANAEIVGLLTSGDEDGPLMINEPDASSGIGAPDSGSDSDVIFVEPAPTQVSILTLTDLPTPDICSLEPRPPIFTNQEILSRFTTFGPTTPLIRPPVDIEQINAIITKYWIRGRHSLRIMASRANQIRCSDVYFLDSVIAYYS